MKWFSRDVSSASMRLTPYERRHYQAVRDLLFRHNYTHSHLDWHESDQWLNGHHVASRLAWAGSRVVGMMAASPPLAGASWIRLAAVRDDADPGEVLRFLWADLRVELAARGAALTALLISRDWLTAHTTALDFTLAEDIVTLRRPTLPAPPDTAPPGLSIRVITPDDIETLTAIDQAAFVTPWQMSRDDVQQATRGAAYTTAALLHDEIIGYQITTAYFDGAHLARLAVLPAAQGIGVGQALLGDSLRRFTKRGLQSMTVNTQLSNDRSQRLYLRNGFARNGFDMPVYFAATDKANE